MLALNQLVQRLFVFYVLPLLFKQNILLKHKTILLFFLEKLCLKQKLVIYLQPLRAISSAGSEHPD